MIVEGPIRRGDQGRSVEYLQYLLRRAGQDVVMDGLYGPRTQAAVASVQREHGWPGRSEAVDTELLRRLEQLTQQGEAAPTSGRAAPPPRPQTWPSKKASGFGTKHGGWRAIDVERVEPVEQQVAQGAATEPGPDEAPLEPPTKAEPPDEAAVSDAPSPPPVAVPDISPDTRRGVDLLGVEGEVQAFARLVCSRRTGTPLSVGLFGDWGTGKSFFMGKLQEAIEARNAAYTRVHTRLREAGDETGLAALRERWHGRVAQISFNAWHFAEPNLWASLVTRVFDELAELINPAESLEDTRARLMAEMSEGKQRREQAKLELRKAEKLLAEARVEREQREAELAQMREELAVVKAASTTGAKASVTTPEGVRAEAEATAVTEQLRVGNPLAALRVTMRWVWTRGRWTRVAVVAAAVLVLLGIVLAIAWWREWLDLQPEIAMLTTAVGVGTGVVSTISAYWAIIAPRLAQTRIAYGTYVEQRGTVEGLLDKALRDLLRPSMSAYDLARQRFEEAEVGLQSATMASEEAWEKVARARRELQELSGGQRFYAFVRDRDETDDYRKHLGLVSMIRQDFARLEEILDQVEREGPGDGEAAPLSRIVLYIDDLDRCEPERVVEVLQAVHLLLATPIFVVVVAVDVRWLRRSLTLHYDRLLRTHREGTPGHEQEARPTPKNYLEKIFQIPFSLRPMDAEGFGALVEGVAGVAAEDEVGTGAAPSTSAEAGTSAAEEADAPPRSAEGAGSSAESTSPELRIERAQELELSHDVVLALEPMEVAFMKGLHAVIDTPRLAKALVNTYRLLRAEIEAEALPGYLERGTFRGVLTLLAIQVGRADDAMRLFEALQHTKEPTLGATLEELCTQTGSDRTEARWRALSAAVRDVGMAEHAVPELAGWLDRIRRFSFNPWPTH